MHFDFKTIAESTSGKITQNIIWHTRNYTLESIIRDRRLLVITFEPSSKPHWAAPDRFRDGWGHTFLRQWDISALYVKSLVSDWYRQADLVAIFESLISVGFFRQFDQIVTYGASMGGFAALVFANMIGADKAIAMQPQTTLDFQKVPWESRFRDASKYDWSSPYSDVADHLRRPVKAYLIYDRWFSLDSQHVDRISDVDAEVVKLNVPFVGHNIPEQLVRMRALQPLFLSIIKDDPFLQDFRSAIRKRRTSSTYFAQIEDRPRVRNSELFSKIVAAFKKKSQIPAAG